MKFLEHILRFREDEDGAVTVDFVVLTAGVAVVGITLALFFQEALTDLTESITSGLGDYDTSISAQLSGGGGGDDD